MATKISDAAQVELLDDDYLIPVGGVSSTAQSVSIGTLAEYAQRYASGVDVVYEYEDSSDFFALPAYLYIRDNLSSHTSYPPLGLMITSGTVKLIVALDEVGKTTWNDATGQVTDTLYYSLADAANDWDGETHMSTAGLADISYAMGYAHTYSRLGNSYSLPKGSWWLPSLPELMLIRSYKAQLNVVLTALRNGGVEDIDRIAATSSFVSYWSSTERSASDAWYVHMDNGNTMYDTKTSGSHQARAVTKVQAYTEI